MAGTNAYTDFLADPDPQARRAELVAFIGPGSAPFLKMYDALQAPAAAGRRPKFGATNSFVVMAFFLGPCWFFYRRLWIWAWSLVAVILFVGFLPLPRNTGVILGVVLAIMGRFAYLQHAILRIAKLRGGGPVADLALLAREGGVSPVAGWVSSVIYVGVTLVVIAGALIVARLGAVAPA